MENEIIQKHNFELAKSRILSASERMPSYVRLNSFPTEGIIFSFNDHNITGKEANELLVSPLQDTLISQNTGIKDLFNIAKEVYSALDYLDKEYISGIVGAIEAAKIASEQAKTASSQAKQASSQALDASTEALDASKKAQIAQTDIKRTIEALQKTVNVLKDFKNDVSAKLNSLSTVHSQIEGIIASVKSLEQGYNNVTQAVNEFHSTYSSINRINHLKDIDAIWSDVEKQKTNIADFHQQVDFFIENVNKTAEYISNDISSLQQYRTLLESYRHLEDVDAIWNDVEGHKANLVDFHQQVDTFIEKVNQTTERINNDIAALQQYRTVLESYQHLGDVDTIWNDVEGHKIDIERIQEKLDSFITEIRITTDEIKESIKKQEEVNSDAHFRFEKRIKIAYYIGGSAVGLSLVNYLLQILGIL